MSEPFSDLQSKICRAVRELIISKGAGSAEDTFAAPCSDDRSLPNTTITVGDGSMADAPGNWEHRITIELRDSAAVQPGETNPQAPRIAANERFTRVVNAMTRSDDTHTLAYTAAQLTEIGRAMATADPENHEDMEDFTVIWLESVATGSSIKSGDGTFWAREIQFRCIAANANLD